MIVTLSAPAKIARQRSAHAARPSSSETLSIYIRFRTSASKRRSRKSSTARRIAPSSDRTSGPASPSSRFLALSSCIRTRLFLWSRFEPSTRSSSCRSTPSSSLASAASTRASSIRWRSRQAFTYPIPDAQSASGRDFWRRAFKTPSSMTGAASGASRPSATRHLIVDSASVMRPARSPYEREFARSGSASPLVAAAAATQSSNPAARPSNTSTSGATAVPTGVTNSETKYIPTTVLTASHTGSQPAVAFMRMAVRVANAPRRARRPVGTEARTLSVASWTTCRVRFASGCATSCGFDGGSAISWGTAPIAARARSDLLLAWIGGTERCTEVVIFPPPSEDAFQRLQRFARVHAAASAARHLIGGLEP